MAYLRFYVGNEFLQDFATQRDNAVQAVQILESASYADNYQVIETKSIEAGMDYIETWNASDEFLNRWYRLQFIGDPLDDPIVKFGVTEPVFPEVINDIIDNVREYFGDTNLDNPAWTDKEYLQAIKFALRQWKGEKNVRFIHDEDVIPIVLLVKEQFANIIAYDHSKYYQLNNGSGASLDKAQIAQNYREMAATLQAQIRAYTERLNMNSGGYNDEKIITQMPHVKTITASRFSRVTGRRVSRDRQPYRRTNFFGPPFLNDEQVD